MKNRYGFAETAVLVYVIVGLIAFFVPNPISTAVGIGIRPNKTIQTEKVEIIKDAQGNPIALKTTTKNDDIQQKVGLLEWLGSLPVFVLFLMVMGAVFPPLAIWLSRIYTQLKSDTKKIIVGVDDAMKAVKDEDLKKLMYLYMGNRQDQSTKSLVDKVQGKK